MTGTFIVHQQGDEKYKNRKGVDVVSKRITLLELGNDGEKLEQFLEYSLTEDNLKAHGDIILSPKWFCMDSASDSPLR